VPSRKREIVKCCCFVGRQIWHEKACAYLFRREPLNKDGLPDNKGRPILIAALLSHKVYYLYHRGWMNAAVLKKCDIEIDNFIGAWMACEKICGRLPLDCI
jgi:hypothetical protein